MSKRKRMCSCCGDREATINKFNDWVCAECNALINVEEPPDLYRDDTEKESVSNETLY